jgi:hypothetical protein
MKSLWQFSANPKDMTSQPIKTSLNDDSLDDLPAVMPPDLTDFIIIPQETLQVNSFYRLRGAFVGKAPLERTHAINSVLSRIPDTRRVRAI